METSKPDLLAASPRTVEDKRILAQLEHGPRAPAIAMRAAGWTVDGWTIGLFALLLFMCGVAWLMHDKRITPETFRQSRASSMVSISAPAAKATPAVPPEEAATIVYEPAATAQAAQISTTNTGEGSAAGVNVAAKPAPTPTAVTAAIANAAQQSSRTAAHKPAAPPARATSVPLPVQSGDTDVTLLTALVAHAGKPTSVAPERSRDIVEHREGDSTALLLARCKQLGMIEGMLCRSRICSGQWETDDACRAPAR
nr:hypothetical protein [uncultured Duganella sp.]